MARLYADEDFPFRLSRNCAALDTTCARFKKPDEVARGLMMRRFSQMPRLTSALC